MAASDETVSELPIVRIQAATHTVELSLRDGERDQVVLGAPMLQQPLAVPGQLARGLLLRRRQRERRFRVFRFPAGARDQGARAGAGALDPALLPGRRMAGLSVRSAEWPTMAS